MIRLIAYLVATLTALSLAVPAFAVKSPKPYVLCSACIGGNNPPTCDAAHNGATFWNQYDQRLYNCRYVNGSWQWV